MPVVYKITWPNGKIYVGSDRTDSIHYFGSPSKKALEQIAKDFSGGQVIGNELTIKKEILWFAAEASKADLIRMEFRFIRQLCANDPNIGYNRAPPFKG